MRRGIMAAFVGLAVCALLSGAFIEGRKEMQREREREAPIKVAARLGRTSRGEPALMLDEEGRRLAALETAPARSAGSLVSVPRGALLRDDGRAWVFVEAEMGRFVRREVALDQPARGSWLLRGGVRIGERVVSVGGQSLLSEELKSGIHVGEEGQH